MKVYVRYIIIWAINTVLILFANSYFPSNYVLGNAVVPPLYAAIFSGLLLTFFDRAAKPVIQKLLVNEKGRYIMFGIYWFTNFVGIWLIARFSFLSGFGISKFTYAITLAFVANLAQWAGRQMFKAVKILK